MSNSFIVFNLIAVIFIICRAVFGFYRNRRFRVQGIILASISLATYALNFGLGSARMFDALSLIFAIAMVCAFFLSAIKNIE